MFSNSKKGSSLILSGERQVPTIISGDMNIVGNLFSEGTIEIAGRIEGNIKCDTLNIHPTGLVKGDVIAKSVKINGEVNGVVKSKQVIIAEKGKVHGFVVYESLSITEGAVIFGQLKQTDRDDISEETITTTVIKEAPAGGGRKIRLVNKNEG